MPRGANDVFRRGADVVKTTLAADLEAFDALPKVVREAVNYHPRKLSAESALALLLAGHPVHTVALAIRNTA